MKKVLKWLAASFGTLTLLVLGFAAYVQVSGIPRYPHSTPVRHVEVTPERVAVGRKLVLSLCAGCHLDPATRKLTGKRMIDAPSEFGVIVSRNITKSTTHGVGGWSDGELAYLLRTGLKPDGTYLPPYMAKLPHLSDEELDGVIAFLRSDDEMVQASEAVPAPTQPSFLTKLLCHLVMKPLPYPTEPIPAPSRTDRVAYGRYLVESRDCFGCHSADFKTVNVLEPAKTPGFMGGGNALLNLNGEKIFSANLTPDAKTGIGKWTETDFARALRYGIRPGGSVLHYPMVPNPELDDDDAGAIYAYLRTVPAIENKAPRYRDVVTAGADDGLRAYQAYGCISCHGETGIAIADLRNANRDFESDGQLLEWVLDAPRLKPGTKMPRFREAIDQKDYASLLRHVRKLSRDAKVETAKL